MVFAKYKIAFERASDKPFAVYTRNDANAWDYINGYSSRGEAEEVITMLYEAEAITPLYYDRNGVHIPVDQKAA